MTSQRLLRSICKNGFVKRHFNTSSSSSNILNETGRFLSTTTQTQPNAQKQEWPQRTALYDLHVKYGGKMVNFAGYSLPIQYDDASINSSHQHTRSNCSIFDVSHMLQTNIYGKHAVEFLESLCVADIAGMKKNHSKLSLFTIDATGGIIDDLIITKVAEDIMYLVSNASRQQADKELLTDRLTSFKAMGKDVRIEFLDVSEQSLIAVQGPKSAQILQPFVNIDLERLYFMNSTLASICGIDDCRITRCGYTGEDGVEISIPSKYVSEVVENLISNDFVRLAGLGARDTLRLEAGLCLYGHDIDCNVTPVEAGLTWTIGKRRRAEKSFPGSEIILKQIQGGINKKRVGIVKYGGPSIRAGTKILGFREEPIGHVTSGCPSPSLGFNIAMGYVDTSYSAVGNEVRLEIRGKLHNASISKMPFGTIHYFTKPKKSS